MDPAAVQRPGPVQAPDRKAAGAAAPRRRQLPQRARLRGKKGIIVCGLADNYLRENLDPDHDYSILSIRQYPLPAGKVRTRRAR